VGEALSALVCKYLDCVIAADQEELESFFGNFVPRSRVREAINALQAARELDFIHVGNRSLIQVTQPKAVVDREAVRLSVTKHVRKDFAPRKRVGTGRSGRPRR
jgi:hypothetical protein